MVTSASSAASSLVTALGGGTGIDLTALAENLAAAQFIGKTERLTAKSDLLDKQISSASSIRSMMLNLSSSLGDRVRSGDLSPQPSVANASVAKASLSGALRPSGTFSLEVTALAAGQTMASPAFAASTSAVASGTLTLRFGALASGGFTDDTAHAPVSLTIPAGATLADVASAINGAGAGVSAFVANTAAGAKLVLKGQTGAANGFVLDATETPGDPGLSALAWSPPAAATDRILASSSDAAYKIDGLQMTAPGNSIVDAVPGLNLTLTATNTGAPTQIGFSDPASAITSAMQDLTTALNQVASALKDATDPLSGDLARDSGAQGLKRGLAGLAGNVIMPGATGTQPRTLADLGLSTQRDGSFQLDNARLAATLKADPAGAAAMFTNGLYGAFASFDALTRRATATGDPGSLGGSVTRYTAQKTRAATDKTDLAARQDALRTQLVARFAKMNTAVGASKSTLSFLQNQIAAWNAKSN
ncbi:MAG: flagellar filament capping protein FliD [Novosphingobium sp.]